jgi:DNA polymerase-3 subunit alpha
MAFFHSHLHSEFSVNDAILRIDDATKRAAELGHPALALTDHGTMAGCVDAYLSCRRHDLIPILGIEAYLVPDADEHPRLAKERADEGNRQGRADGHRKQVTTVAREAARMRRHCLLMARDFEGYQRLCRAVTRSHSQGYFKPLFQFADLDELAEGGHIWLTTGCLNGEIPKLIVEGRLEHAERRLLHYRERYGDRFIVELQHHGFPEDDQVVDALWDLAQRHSLPVLAAHDVHYLNREDQDVHDFYKRMAYKREPGQSAEFGGDTGFHLCDGDLLRERLGDKRYGEALLGLSSLAEDCRSMTFPPLDSYSYEVPQVVEADPLRALMAITKPTLDRMIDGLSQTKREAYRTRYGQEMKVIRDTGFAQYFLLVRLIVKFCEDNHIFVIARGSASGSLVCRLLGITQLDPIKHHLLFERFLSNDRTKPPDIDLDVEDDRRDEVLEYVSRRFATTQIGTAMTYAERSARNEVAAQLRRDEAELSAYTDDELLATDIGKHLLEKVQGLRRGFGGHPAGVVAETTGRPIADLVPLMKISSSDRWVTQYDMDAIERLGFVKVDILGVRSLRTVRRCLELMGKVDWDWIPDRDPATQKMLAAGKTEGVFTFKGWSAKKGCQLLRPKSLDDCSIVAAMWRPSCLELGLEQLYLERRSERWKPPANWHPVLAEVLKETYGIAVYQEQVIQIMKGLGFSADDVMTMLRAVKKKDAILMAEVRRRIAEKEPALVDQLWELMEGYTRYGFNRSHSYAYARFGYRMAYLKANHPIEFFCALLETNTTKTDQQDYVRAARAAGIRVLGACVLRSGVTWSMEKNGLRRGLTSVPGVGERAANEIVNARPFDSIETLRANVNPVACNVGVFKKLASARALAALGIEDQEEFEQTLAKR